MYGQIQSKLTKPPHKEQKKINRMQWNHVFDSLQTANKGVVSAHPIPTEINLVKASEISELSGEDAPESGSRYRWKGYFWRCLTSRGGEFTAPPQSHLPQEAVDTCPQKVAWRRLASGDEKGACAEVEGRMGPVQSMTHLGCRDRPDTTAVTTLWICLTLCTRLFFQWLSGVFQLLSTWEPLAAGARSWTWALLFARPVLCH